jgi:hypothetical protein
MPTDCLQEWTDAASRDTAAPFLQQLIALDPARDAAAAGAGASMDTDSSSRGRGSSSSRRHAAVAQQEEDTEGDELPGLQLSGNGGDGMFEAAVVQLVAAMEGSGAGFMAAMLDGSAALAAAAGLLRKPAAAAAAGDAAGEGVEQRHAVFTGVTWGMLRGVSSRGDANNSSQNMAKCCIFCVLQTAVKTAGHLYTGMPCCCCTCLCVPAVGAADSTQVLQVLCYIRMMLQQLPLRQYGAPLDAGASDASISFSSLWELLLLLVLKQEHTLVR